MFSILKTIHLVCVALSITGYVIRGIGMIRESPWSERNGCGCCRMFIRIGNAIFYVANCLGTQTSSRATHRRCAGQRGKRVFENFGYRTNRDEDPAQVEHL